MTQDNDKSQSFGFNRPRDETQPPNDGAAHGTIKQATESEVLQFVTPLKSFEQQIGEHVMRALAAPETVAVVTAVVVGPDGQQRIVSAALDPKMMTQVQQMFGEAAEQRTEEIPCVGFHCYINPKDDSKSRTDDESKSAES